MLFLKRKKRKNAVRLRSRHTFGETQPQAEGDYELKLWVDQSLKANIVEDRLQQVEDDRQQEVHNDEFEMFV